MNNASLVTKYSMNTISDNAIDSLLKEVGIERKVFDDYMLGSAQLMAICENCKEFKEMYYPWDVLQFLDEMDKD